MFNVVTTVAGRAKRIAVSAGFGLAVLGFAGAAAASPGCDAINAIWGGGVTLNNGLELYEPWPLPPMKAGDEVVYVASTTGSTNTHIPSGGGFALYKNEGTAWPDDILIEEYGSQGAELSLNGRYVLTDDNVGFIVYGWSGSGDATLRATVTCTAAAAAPTITSLSPSTGSADGGDSVVITGTDFTGATAVMFGSMNAVSFTVNSATRITAIAPANPGGGAAPVTVTTALGSSSASGASTYTYVQRPAAPTFTSAPPLITNATSATFAFDLSAGASALSSLDGAAFQPATNPLTFTALNDGAHTFRVKSVISGVESDVTTYAWTIDTIVPAPPVVTPLTPGANRRPTFQGTAEIGSMMRVFVDGALAGTVISDGSGNWMIISGDLVDGPHTVQASAADAAGNVSSLSLPVSFVTASPPVSSNLSVSIPYGVPNVVIALANQITGVHTSITIVSAPTHGEVEWSGSSVIYTPTIGYFGPDTFTYTATGPGGTSTAATVSLTVAAPGAPVAANVTGVAVAYDSAGQAIDLSASITGVHASIAIGTAPGHGTTSISGDVVTYRPNAGYFGADSFTYTATGPGGTSAAATVSLTVAAPGAPVAANVTGVAVAYDSAGQAIDLSASITGVHASITIGTAPAHGTATISGDIVTYRPNAGYFGPDSFTYTATGPGGTSAAATVSLTVAAPGAPVAANANGVAVAYDSAGQAIDLSTSITGVHASIAIGTAPAHGTASISGDVVTYRPNAGYFGADSFTYTATGPGGTSAAATVSLTVAAPGAPVAANANGVAVAYDSAGQAIDLSASITGVHTSIAIGTAPAHGTTSISGDVVTYRPNAGYFGADSFTYTATGPGGTSTAATVSLTVAAPGAPVAANVTGVAVAYDSAGQAIDLSASITGVHASITIGTAPAHGTATISGDIVTYRPNAGYFGADSFTYTATGPGGTSAAATVSLTVAAPTAPEIDPPAPVVVQPTPGGAATVDLPPASSGTVTSYRVEDQPAHGQVVIQPPGAGASGWSVAYTPAPGFMGEDTIAVVAVGPAGESAPATMTFRVLGAAPDLQGTTLDGATLTFEPTASLTGGPFQGLAITRQPNSGTAQVDGLRIIYTPAASAGSASRRMAMRSASVAPAAGPVSMEYTVILPFGASLPGTIEIEAAATTPTLTPLIATTLAGRPVTVSLTDTATGGPFVAATVVSVSDDAGTATLTEGGVAGNRTYALTFTPAGDFTGLANVTYSLSNAGGAATGVLAITVEARPDPSLDPDVRGLVSAQADTARRFARSQADNFHRRLEQVRRGGVTGLSNQMRMNLGDGGLNQDPREALRQQLGQSPGDRDDGFNTLAAVRARAVDGDETPAANAPVASASPGKVGVWTAGAIDWGRRDAQGQRDYRFSTSGVSAGVDMAISDRLIAGVGVGYGHDRTKVGDNGTLSEGDSYVGALYGSWRATGDLVVDGVLGYGALEFDSRRWSSDADDFAFGERSGSVLFGSASVALERRSAGLAWAPYARLQFGKVELDGYSETGADVFALTYDAMTVDTLATALGTSFDWTLQRRSGVLTPSLRVEWRHEFEGADDQAVSYADWLASPDYLVGLERWARDSVSLGAGVQWRAVSGWSYGVDYQGQLGSDLSSHGLRLRLMKLF
ncbi:MAG: Ig-like domain-containing protein [Candidatus Brevundimonas phytovorans]|nr:Ig-like domain-containing protein [Brevundimonas sp.]WEK58923.1 MAG: Ig-like domain-containing protein [Brevundimonas sp.]